MNELNSILDDMFSLLRESKENNAIKNEIIDILDLISNKKLPDSISESTIKSFQSCMLREEYIKKAGFSLITNKFIRNLAKYIGNSKCLEILSGKGALSKCLQEQGVKIKATDNFSWHDRLDMSDLWTDVEKIDCLEAIRKYGKDTDYIICSWIPYNSTIGTQILKEMDKVNPNCKLIVIGEGPGGCTADDSFFDNIECVHSDYLGEDDIKGFQRWNCIYDSVKVVKYKKDHV